MLRRAVAVLVLVVPASAASASAETDAPGQFLVLPRPRFEPASGLTGGLLAGELSNFARIFAITF